MTIDKDKILTINAGDCMAHFSSFDSNIENLRPLGVHSDISLDGLASKVPDEAVIATDYVFSIAVCEGSVAHYRGSCTAWVPKER